MDQSSRPCHCRVTRGECCANRMRCPPTVSPFAENARIARRQTIVRFGSDLYPSAPGRKLPSPTVDPLPTVVLQKKRSFADCARARGRPPPNHRITAEQGLAATTWRDGCDPASLGHRARTGKVRQKWAKDRESKALASQLPHVPRKGRAPAEIDTSIARHG